MALLETPAPRLSERTTLRMGGTALAELTAREEQDLLVLPEALERLGGTPVVLGRGSNVLAREGELDLVLVGAALDHGPDVLRSEQDRALVAVGAGVSLPRVLAWAAARGLSGLEPLSGIPGSLGGAVAMNAGSYGRELGELLARVRVWTPEHGLRWLERDAFGYGYRTFAPRHAKGLFVVAGAELWLERSRRDAVRAAMREHYGRKKAGQPVTARSAGCVFKNPAPEAPAGLLLDRAGFRGRRLGEVAFSEVHANFLVNLGRGTADQALELIGQAREAVLARSGHHLEMEVRVWP